MKIYRTNAYKKEEINLLNRLEKYCDNHLLFLKKFFVPFSNNRAESDLRGIKIKQKTGKFRSVEVANIYAVIKSCISTYIKNNINTFNALISLLNGNPILV
ncbi:MAG: transposase [Bacilli bacterium]|nr:transposase [Bacilli bacterium]